MTEHNEAVAEEFFDAQEFQGQKIGGFFLEETHHMVDFIESAYQFFKIKGNDQHKPDADNPKMARLYKDYKPECIKPFTNSQGKVAGYVAFDPVKKSAMIVYRGTKTLQDVQTDMRFLPAQSNDCPQKGNVASGFQDDFESSWPQVEATLQAHALINNIDIRKMPITVSGHSLGGALATLCTLRLRVLLGVESLRCFTIGSPRVLSLSLAAFYESLNIPTLRVSQDYSDPVPAVSPAWIAATKHVGEHFVVSRHGKTPHTVAGYKEGLVNLSEEDFKQQQGQKNYAGIAIRHLSAAVRTVVSPLVALPNVFAASPQPQEPRDGFVLARNERFEDGFVLVDEDLNTPSPFSPATPLTDQSDADWTIVDEDEDFVLAEKEPDASQTLSPTGPSMNQSHADWTIVDEDEVFVLAEEEPDAPSNSLPAVMSTDEQGISFDDAHRVELSETKDSTAEPTVQSSAETSFSRGLIGRCLNHTQALLKALDPSSNPTASSFVRLISSGLFR